MKPLAVMAASLFLSFVGCSDTSPMAAEPSDSPADTAAKLTVSGTKAGGTAERRRPPQGSSDTVHDATGRWVFEGWVAGEFARDLNGDDVIDKADFDLFINQHPSDGGLVPVEDPRIHPPLPVIEPVIEIERPTLFIAGSKAELEPILSWLTDPADRTRAKEIDFAQARAVVALRGRMNTAGFDLDIVQVQAEEERVQIVVELTDPAPDALVAQVITYPYELIVIPYSDVPAAPAAWEMISTDGEFLVGTHYPHAASSGGSTGSETPVDIGTLPEPVPDSGLEDPVATDKIDIRGEIVALNPDQGLGWVEDLLGSVRIEGTMEDDTQFDQAVVTISRATQLWRAQTDGLEAIAFADLAEAQRVEVRFSGPVAESFPVQALAGRLVVLQ